MSGMDDYEMFGNLAFLGVLAGDLSSAVRYTRKGDTAEAEHRVQVALEAIIEHASAWRDGLSGTPGAPRAHGDQDGG